MKRIITTVTLMISIIITVNSQDIKQLIIGDWVKTKITKASNGEITTGKYGEKDSYLRFTFKSKLFYPAITPFEQGDGIKYNIEKNKIIFFLPSVFIPPYESDYIIKSVDTSNLVLYTTNQEKDTICYYFKKLNPISKSDTSFLFENIYIKHIYFSHGGINKTCIYDFKSNEYIKSTPIYKNGHSFGYYLSNSIYMPTSYKKGEFSGKMYVQVIIDNKGKIISSEVTESINPKIDRQVLKYINKTKWLINNEEIEQPIKITFVFNLFAVKGNLIKL